MGRRKNAAGLATHSAARCREWGLRYKRDREEHDHEDRLCQKSNHPRSACSHRSIGVPGIGRGEGGEEPASARKNPPASMSPHESERQRIIGSEPGSGSQRQGITNTGRSEAKDPCRLRRNDFVFVEELPQVAIRLKDIWSALALDVLLNRLSTPEYRGAKRYEQKLKEAVDNGP